MGENTKQRKSQLVHIVYDNDRQLKLVMDTFEQFGMEAEKLGPKEEYDGNIKFQSRLKEINPWNEGLKIAVICMGILLVILVITAMITGAQGVDFQAAYK